MPPRPIGVIASGADPVRSLREVKALGMECCQLTMPGSDWFRDPGLSSLKATIAETGIAIVGFFCHFRGESYADIPTIQRTVGLVNPATRRERVEIVLRNSNEVAALGTRALLAHIGFIPEDREGQDYHELVHAMRSICDRCAGNRQQFGLETGQETAPALKQFITDVERPNLKVNFDPANMLLYGSGKPLEALQILTPYLISVHCKDGHWPTRAGQLGEEAALGEGEVNIPAFIGYLRDIEFSGPLVIEREISGEQQQRDIRRARELIVGLR